MQNRLLSAKATLPDYDRAALVARMVHLGFGAFHRAHQGVYTDILAAEQHSDWGYYEVNLIGGEQQIADLKQQDNLYTVAEMSAEAWTARVVGVVKAALHVQVDGLERVLAAMCEPQIAIVSLTITEKGYCHSPATGQLLLEHPMIAADLQNPHQPLTAPGIIVEALARRKAAGLSAFTVIPQRMLDSVRWHLANHSDFDLLALGVAGWMRYVGGVDEQGKAIDVSDPLLPVIQRAVANSEEGASRVKALLGMAEIFGNDLPQAARFTQKVQEAYDSLLTYGAKASVAKYAERLK
ncbi:hypothetical protein F8764_05975 [Salmonella enterica]|nr:hypothetical protein [Salmonella enterica]EFO8331957.1 hypothetical protein [Salmonella enterica]EHN6803105.1 hypothetical protein [Salmonella enterica]